MIRTMALGLSLAAALAGATAAQQEAQQDEAQQAGPQTARADGALLRGLDKVSGQTTDLMVRVGDAVNYGRLEVRLGECRFPAGAPSSDAFAQMTVTDTRQNRTLFSGWMVASSPALSALDDPRYDVWVISCQS